MNLFAPSKPKPPITEVPSIREQGLDVGIIDFGKARRPDTDYFNCALLERNDGLWLVTRRAIWDKRDKLGYNDVVAFSLDRNLKPMMGQAVKLGQQWDIEHFEDPRAYFVNGKTYVSACNFIRNGKGCCFPHQVICEVANDWSLIKRYDPVFANNGNDTASNISHEKNWTWIFQPNPILVYWSSPHTLIEFDWQFKLTVPHVRYETEWDANLWKYGQVRGGSPPVLYRGRYWTFFHSSTPFNSRKRQYHMGCYSFEMVPPYRLTSITERPLLSGSTRDRWNDGKPPCVFAGSAMIKDGVWIITGGVNDLDCFWCKLPHGELKKRMVEI